MRTPDLVTVVVGADLPRTDNALTRRLGRLALRCLRWRVVGELPDRARLVIIVAPHTSNWDFVVGLAAKWALDVRAAWLGKHTLFRAPWGWFFRAVGGIPVNRGASSDVVAQTVAEFAARERLVLALAPQGTRRAGARWRTGFWHIAYGAGVPIVCVSLDYARREVRFGPTLQPQDPAADLATIQAHYAAVRGRRG